MEPTTYGGREKASQLILSEMVERDTENTCRGRGGTMTSEIGEPFVTWPLKVSLMQ
jgi:hypothetical protein